MSESKRLRATKIILDIHFGMDPSEVIEQFEFDNDSDWVEVNNAVRCAALQASFLGRSDVEAKLERCAALIADRATAKSAVLMQQRQQMDQQVPA